MSPNILKVLEIQGAIKVSMTGQGIDELLADNLAGKYVQLFIISGLLNDDVQLEIERFIKENKE